MTKKNVLLTGLSGTILFVFLVLLGTDACYMNTTCKSLRVALSDDSLVVTLFFPCVFIFSLITYKMKDEIYRAWLHFSYVWIPLSVILILMSSDRSGHLFVSAQEFLAMLLFGFYILVSSVIIAWKYFSMRHNKSV